MKRVLLTIMAVMFGLSMLTPSAMARANEKRAHQIAIGSTAAAAYLLMHHKTRGVGVLAAGGAAYAWKKHHDAVKQRHQIQNRRAYRGSGYYGSGRYARNSRAKNGYYRNHKNGYYRSRATSRR